MVETFSENDNFTLLYQNFENQFMELLRTNPFTLFLQKQSLEIERLNKHFKDMEFKLESYVKNNDFEPFKSRITELEKENKCNQKERESLLSEIRDLQVENNELKNKTLRMSKEINQLQNTAKEFNEIKSQVINTESQVQQNIEDNIALEIRVNKLEKVEADREKHSARIRARNYSTGNSGFKKISQINDKYKSPLTSDLEKKIYDVIDLDSGYTRTNLLPAYGFFNSIKQFSDKFLHGEEIDENISLSTYLCDSSLNFWPQNVSKELVKELIPTSLKVKHTFAAYDFIIEQVSQYHEFEQKLKNNS
ncbi:11698_t:CDS:2 [Diversispora eburnea]|uniref:11698_t:CDS:1 n=1 Tax=Diversispora eburnea TaxID=1213867 RepID=A0A9N8WJ40_9GLOM|nr:11698_t:CDS:2 [Diversispora eburnea]